MGPHQHSGESVKARRSRNPTNRDGARAKRVIISAADLRSDARTPETTRAAKIRESKVRDSGGKVEGGGGEAAGSGVQRDGESDSHRE